MSVKRQATTELNHENWDQEDESEQNDMGIFQAAPKEVLEKRVIRTAKRRSGAQAGDAAKKNVFSGFGGFNKTQPSSFDFLANLTNGSKPTNGTDTEKSESATTALFSSSKPTTSSVGAGFFSMPMSSSTTKPTFGVPATQSSLFSASNTTATQSPFGTTKPSESPFKIQAASSDTKINDINKGSPNATKPQTQSPFGASNSAESPFKMQSSPSVTKTDDANKSANPPSIFGSSTTAAKSQFSTQSTSSPFKMASTAQSKNKPASEQEKKADDSEIKKLTYYAKLKGLNESVLDWIKKHVEESPLCLLSPIFKDYEKYLKEIQDEYHESDSETKAPSAKSITEKSNAESSPAKSSFASSTNAVESSSFSSTKPGIFGNQSNSSSAEKPSGFSFGINPSNTAVKSSSSEKPNTESSPVKSSSTFGSTSSTSPFSSTKASVFGNQANSSTADKPSGFSFGINTSSSTATTTSGGFFGMNSSPQTTAAGASPFTLITNASTPSNGPTSSFSFGGGKPFSFNNVQKRPEAATDEKDEDDEPPKVEFTPVVEENSVFDKRCKIFVKKDGNFADKGVGTLYIKKIEETGKHQLLVRANTNLGNVLLNLILVSSLPTQRLGKNNVMLVCIPTPEAEPPPTPVLIRVKTSEEADELLETLNKYKA